jgi:hypothetical protein
MQTGVQTTEGAKMTTTTATEIRIIKASGIGILRKAADGRWDIEVNGKRGGAQYYTQDQVDSIVAKANAAGDKVEVR